MRKKKARPRNSSFSATLFVLFGAAFFLIIYLVRTTDKLIKIQTVNAEVARQVILPVVPTGASCGT